jgi:hypothetical protein
MRYALVLSLPSSWGIRSLTTLQFGHFLSVNLGQLMTCPTFPEMFRRQLDTLLKIEDEESAESDLNDQVRLRL